MCCKLGADSMATRKRKLLKVIILGDSGCARMCSAHGGVLCCVAALKREPSQVCM